MLEIVLVVSAGWIPDLFLLCGSRYEEDRCALAVPRCKRFCQGIVVGWMNKLSFNTTKDGPSVVQCQTGDCITAQKTNAKTCFAHF